MFCDVFNKKQANDLLENKKIWFVGSSNMRAIYKDVLWLTQHECLASDMTFKVKNEPSFCKDNRLSNDTLHNGRDYKETREFKSEKLYLFFHFITRNYQEHFLDLIKNLKPETAPDVIFLNSCLWDISRWGPDGPAQFKENIMRTMKFLKTELPAKTRVIWKTTLPVSTSADGAIFVDEIKFIVPMLPWHILEANSYASTCADFFNFDTLDFHHFMRLQGHLRVKDGIHWSPLALRFLTNCFLTHLSLCWGKKLPGHFKPNNRFLSLTTKTKIQETEFKERVDKKAGFFKKLFAKKDDKKKKGPLAGIKNTILAASKTIFKKRKRNNKPKNVNNQIISQINSASGSNSALGNFSSRNGINYSNNFPYQQRFGFNPQFQAVQKALALESEYYRIVNFYDRYNFPNRRY